MQNKQTNDGAQGQGKDPSGLILGVEPVGATPGGTTPKDADGRDG